jgi:hypothetical protein
MTRFKHKVLMDNLRTAGIENTLARHCINIDESQVFQSHEKIVVVGPRSSVLKHVAAREADVSLHISIVAAVSAAGLPWGKPIFIIEGASVPAALAGYTEHCLFITSPGGGQTAETWDACCQYWAGLAE